VKDLLAGELIKVHTTRTALGFGLAAVLLTLANVLITLLATDPATIEDKRTALNFGGLLAIVLLVYGAVGATGEYRHRTHAPAVLIAPDRVRLSFARMGAYGLSAAVFGVAMCVVSFGLGLALLANATGADLTAGDYVSLGTGGLLAAMLCTVLGVAAGTLLRSQVGAVVGVLVWLFILEPLVGLIDEDLIKYTVGISSGALGAGGNDDASMATGALVLATWTAVLAAAGALADRRRDVD
jgi:ABC-2 type transport system permease protein